MNLPSATSLDVRIKYRYAAALSERKNSGGVCFRWKSKFRRFALALHERAWYLAVKRSISGLV